VIIGASGGGSGILFIIVIAFLLLYLIVVRPQKRRQNQQKQMMSDLRVGDEVLTAGGIYGTVSELAEDEVTVEIAPSLEVRVARRAIAGVTREPEEQDESEEAEESESTEPTEPADEGDPPKGDHAGSGAETSNEENRG
jgi:preprotein translocase subunit YajC